MTFSLCGLDDATSFFSARPYGNKKEKKEIIVSMLTTDGESIERKDDILVERKKMRNVWSPFVSETNPLFLVLSLGGQNFFHALLHCPGVYLWPVGP